MKLPKKVAKLARKVRKHFERIAKHENFSKNLEGLCLRASATLVNQLTKNGFKAKLIQGFAFDPDTQYENHVWVLFRDHVIDVTATQFGVWRKVHVVRKSSIDYRPGKYWSFCSWPFEQRPKKSDYAI